MKQALCIDLSHRHAGKFHSLARPLGAALALALLLPFAGCQTAAPSAESIAQSFGEPPPVTLRDGDTVRFSFPRTPNLDTTQQIRRDGKIALPMVGEIDAVGLTPAELSKKASELYAKELVSDEVNVTVVSSSFPVFVIGAVMRPGKIQSERAITALEAVMEVGGFDFAKANQKAVVVVRREQGQVKSYTLNLRLALEGKATEPFFLKPSDIVYVPERFSWF
ncbi:MAG TPA: polysaccharide biosynthesis/export family protein [Opitutaceae bacterium]